MRVKPYEYLDAGQPEVVQRGSPWYEKLCSCCLSAHGIAHTYDKKIRCHLNNLRPFKKALKTERKFDESKLK